MFKIDALSPALKSLEVSGGELLAAPSSCLEKAGAAATEGAARTASMVARAGRASYVSRDKVREDTQKQKYGSINPLCPPLTLVIHVPFHENLEL